MNPRFRYREACSFPLLSIIGSDSILKFRQPLFKSF